MYELVSALSDGIAHEGSGGDGVGEDLEGRGRGGETPWRRGVMKKNHPICVSASD